MYLIDIQRATQNAALAAVGASSSAYLDSLVAAASEMVRKYCHRDFVSTNYTEYHNGGIYFKDPVPLRQFPVTNVSAVSIANRAMLVQNNGYSGTVQKATVQTMSNGDVKLVSTASAVATATTLAAVTYKTLAAAAAAINALSSAGWIATVLSGTTGSYGLFPVADLKVLQGAASAMAGGTYLDIYEQWNPGTYPDPGWADDTEFGSYSGGGWRLDAETGEMYGVFPRGRMNIRIDYAAGFAEVPAAVQEATVQIARNLHDSAGANGAVKSVRLGNTSKEFRDVAISPIVKMMLSPYIDHSRVINR